MPIISPELRSGDEREKILEELDSLFAEIVLQPPHFQLPEEFGGNDARISLSEEDLNSIISQAINAVFAKIKDKIDTLKQIDPDFFDIAVRELMEEDEAYLNPSLKEKIDTYLNKCLKKKR